MRWMDGQRVYRWMERWIERERKREFPPSPPPTAATSLSSIFSSFFFNKTYFRCIHTTGGLYEMEAADTLNGH